MKEIIDIMLRYFSDSKLAGSYFLLFLVSIVLLYYMNRQKNRWFIMYGILLLVVVVMNPVSVWMMVQVFPSLISYGPITMLVPILIYIPFAAAELNESLKEIRIRRIVTVILVFLIFICGNMCGMVKDYSVSDSNVTDAEELDVPLLDAVFVLKARKLFVDVLDDLRTVGLGQADAVETFVRHDRFEVLLPVFGVGTVDAYGHFRIAEVAAAKEL